MAFRYILLQAADSAAILPVILLYRTDFAAILLLTLRCQTDFAANPPRPLASRRVDALNQATNPPNLQNLKQAHKGEGLPSPYPLPTAPFRCIILATFSPDMRML